MSPHRCASAPHTGPFQHAMTCQPSQQLDAPVSTSGTRLFCSIGVEYTQSGRHAGVTPYDSNHVLMPASAMAPSCLLPSTMSPSRKRTSDGRPYTCISTHYELPKLCLAGACMQNIVAANHNVYRLAHVKARSSDPTEQDLLVRCNTLCSASSPRALH